MDARGYVRITGRIKELIIRGGENIAPKEIEDLLRGNPKIVDIYVYGIRMRDWVKKWLRRSS